MEKQGREFTDGFSACFQSFPALYPVYERWTPDTCLLQGWASGPHSIFLRIHMGSLCPAFSCVPLPPTARVSVHQAATAFLRCPNSQPRAFATCPGVVPGICFFLSPKELPHLAVAVRQDLQLRGRVFPNLSHAQAGACFTTFFTAGALRRKSNASASCRGGRHIPGKPALDGL